MRYKKTQIVKMNFTLVCLLMGFTMAAQVKIGDNEDPGTVGESSLPELESLNKGLVVTRVANTEAIAAPVNGMIIYDISTHCIKSYENGTWTGCWSNSPKLDPSTNGTGTVSAYSCSTAAAGNLYVGIPVTGVTQAITAQVTQMGTYNISAISNGVIFNAVGIFTALGAQTIWLTATGTPITSGMHDFIPNTLPSCSFTRNITDLSTNGTATATSYDCSGSSSGTMTVGIPVSNVTQTITAMISAPGAYTIATNTVNGITFSASGSFTNTGTQAITLTATGIPIAGGTHSFTLNTIPGCSFSRGVINSSSNGTAVVSSYNCNTASSGTMTVGIPVLGVYQTITATVDAIGTYNISTTANGVTFAASGTFTSIGAQTITLMASGTPIASGSHTYTLNTTPGCNFTRTIIHPSSGGTAVVTINSCTSSSMGTMMSGIPVLGVTQAVIFNVVAVGTYNISATANGVTFAASGNFSNIGSQLITLMATGTPTAAGSHIFNLNTTPGCSFIRNTLDCSMMLYSSFPVTTPVRTASGGTSVAITMTGNNNGTMAYASQCGILTNAVPCIDLPATNGVTYRFSVPLKNVEVYGYHNEGAEAEGYAVTASLAGTSIPVQLVKSGGNCQGSFSTSQSGNTGRIYNSTSSNSGSGIKFTISTNSPYDTITISRYTVYGAGGGNGHGLMLCNATAIP